MPAVFKIRGLMVKVTCWKKFMHHVIAIQAKPSELVLYLIDDYLLVYNIIIPKWMVFNCSLQTGGLQSSVYGERKMLQPAQTSMIVELYSQSGHLEMNAVMIDCCFSKEMHSAVDWSSKVKY